MTVQPKTGTSVRVGFQRASVVFAISDIVPQRAISAAVKRTTKYRQILASIEEVGIIEPPVVWPIESGEGKHLLVHGHFRLEALKDLGRTEVVCLVATDDESFTYNRHVSRVATIQEHRMILKAIERGVRPERIAKALNVDPTSLRFRIKLIESICTEAAELLKDKHVPLNAFAVLRKMVPMRQIEVAERMIAMNCYSASFADALLAATPQADLAQAARPKKVRTLTPEQMAAMERESANLDREYKALEETHGIDHLDLVLAIGYLSKLLANARVVRYLAQNQTDLLAEFQKILELGRNVSTELGSAGSRELTATSAIADAPT